MQEIISRLVRMVDEATVLMENAPENMQEYMQGRVDQATFALESARNIFAENHLGGHNHEPEAVDPALVP